jgi:hypothetical protein
MAGVTFGGIVVGVDDCDTAGKGVEEYDRL